EYTLIIRQCLPSPVTGDDCDQLSQVTHVSNGTGAGSFDFLVRELPDPELPGPTTCNRATSCVITVSADLNDLSENAASAPITLSDIATKLKASPVIARLLPSLRIFYPNVNAKLTVASNGIPIPGKSVAFTTGFHSLCSANTDASGVATCSGSAPLLAIQRFGRYTATFAGDDSYGPSSDTAAGSLFAF
ncbi:MAG: Ig-like domain-containing protein, partial [Pseudonocardiaceae bacterium]